MPRSRLPHIHVWTALTPDYRPKEKKEMAGFGMVCSNEHQVREFYLLLGT